MNNIQFKAKIIELGVKLNGIFCGYDVVVNKELEVNIRMRKNPHKPTIRQGEIVIIKSLEPKDREPILRTIAKDAVNTTLALLDVTVSEGLDLTPYKEQIDHQKELIKAYTIVEFINGITPQEQIRLFHKLGIKNAEQLVNGTDTVPVY